MIARKPMTAGEVFGRLTVLDAAEPKWNPSGFRIYRVRAKCECGEETIVYESKLRYGSTRSCGCLERWSSINNLPKGHGHAKHKNHSPTYTSWRSMISRCRHKRSNGYENYGGRGIIVCERWNKFDNFLQDMGERPKGKTIDRINPEGNYEPSNCRWASILQQEGNRRNNVYVMIGDQRLCLAQAARSLGIAPGSVSRRAKYHKVSVQIIIDRLAKEAIL